MNMQLLEDALNCSRCVISVMGDHAREGVDKIFQRKTADIDRTGKTFWLMRSPKARPLQVQGICQTAPAYAIFISPASKGGARPTTTEEVASEYAENREVWLPLPKDISPVTGKLDNSAAALVFDMLTTEVSGLLDLWNYGDLADIQKPLRFILGCSTICTVKKDMTAHPEKMKSRYRKVVAIARIARPYCVWLR
jgi:hypothetical protein